MSHPGFTPAEIMTIEASRRLKNGTVCFVGIGLPSAAANLARLTHAPDVVLVYGSGAIGARPEILPMSIGEGELAEYADTVVSVPEFFRYWLQGGRIDVGFLRAVQIDRFGNINTSAIGPDYARPATRLSGAGSAPEIASNARETWIMLEQSTRTFVEKLDFRTAAGYLDGGDARARSGARGAGPTAVFTDLGVLTPDPVTKELTLIATHPGVTVEAAKAATGWDLKVSPHATQTAEPSQLELVTLRDLYIRTARTHGTKVPES